MLGTRITDMFRAVDQCDWSSLGDFYTADCVYLRPGFPELRSVHEVLHFYASVRSVASGQHELLHVVEEGSSVSAAGRLQGLLKSGAPIDLQFMDLYLFDDYRIRYRQTFFYTPLA